MRNSPPTIAALWDAFDKKPTQTTKDNHPLAYKDIRLAFYQGAWSTR